MRGSGSRLIWRSFLRSICAPQLVDIVGFHNAADHKQCVSLAARMCGRCAYGCSSGMIGADVTSRLVTETKEGSVLMTAAGTVPPRKRASQDCRAPNDSWWFRGGSS
jgi:hypothetical protein